METLKTEVVVEKTLVKLRTQLFDKGAKGLHGIARAFRIADFDGSGQLDREEFEECLQFAGLFISSQETSALFKYFDRNGEGSVDFEEFLTTLRGELNDRRRAMVEKAFKTLDRDNSGSVGLEDMRGVFTAKKHPEVMAGRVTEDDVFKAFLNQFEGESKDNRVTPEEFARYYTDISASIPDDDYFIAMMQSCWCMTEGAASAEDVEKIRRYEELLREKVRQTCKTTESPKTRLQSVFRFFDTDRTGGVTIDEMTGALARLGLPLPRKDVLLFFQLYDQDNSGSITYSEFVAKMYPDA